MHQLPLRIVIRHGRAGRRYEEIDHHPAALEDRNGQDWHTEHRAKDDERLVSTMHSPNKPHHLVPNREEWGRYQRERGKGRENGNNSHLGAM